MVSHVEGFHGPLAVEQFRGGQSNPTYLLDAGSGRYVLRRKPPGRLLKSAHAVDREFRIISALYAVDFPVARPYVLCEDDAVIGTMFYIMECVDGRIFWEPDLPGCDPAERAAIYDDVNATLARLHGYDYRHLGLEDYGKPGNYFARQISRWSGQYRASETVTIDAMDRLIDWLPEHIPADDSASIVHGDFRLDNMVLHPEEPRVIAVLDWELSTIGHPLADFTYHLMAWQMPDVGIGSAGLVGRDRGPGCVVAVVVAGTLDALAQTRAEEPSPTAVAFLRLERAGGDDLLGGDALSRCFAAHAACRVADELGNAAAVIVGAAERGR